MTIQVSEKINFKKLVGYLIIFQLLTGICLGLLLFAASTFTQLPIYLTKGSGIISIIVGGYIFGTWIEAKYPGTLTKKIIKTISFFVTVINAIVILISFFLLASFRSFSITLLT